MQYVECGVRVYVWVCMVCGVCECVYVCVCVCVCVRTAVCLTTPRTSVHHPGKSQPDKGLAWPGASGMRVFILPEGVPFVRTSILGEGWTASVVENPPVFCCSPKRSRSAVTETV